MVDYNKLRKLGKDDERVSSAVRTREARDSTLRELIEKTDRNIDKLKVDWEKYFLGIENRPPDFLMKDTERLFREMIKQRSLKTALKFRTQVLRDRWTTMKLYWGRNMRMIEEGTHPRQKRLMSLREKEQALQDRLSSSPDKKQQAAAAQNAAAGRAPAAAAPAAAGAPASAHAAGSGELFKDFIMARAKCGQSVQGITPEKLSAQLQAQAAKIQAATGAQNVKFRVVVEDGKPKVKAVTR